MRVPVLVSGDVCTMDLETRIDAVYLALTGARSAWGARSWFARQARVRPSTVSRWLSGARPFAGAPLAVLEQLEARAAALPDPERIRS